MKICNGSDCTGCFACMNACPKNAIYIGEDTYGCYIPKINIEKCVGCGLCKRVCPANTHVQFNLAETAYAVWSTVEDDVKHSSSGGAASIFSRYVLKNGGYVYGAACENNTTHHICIENLQDISKLRGSKYVQSNIGLIYIDVKENLKKGKNVLFVGTPCQIAGLNAYLGEPYGNLITVDLICHGTPPHKQLTEHIDTVLKGKMWDGYTFRGEYDFNLTVYRNGEIVYNMDRLQDEFFLAFLKGLNYRESCYTCRYAKFERVSDITIGDFWGLNRANLINSYQGRVSVVLPNTEKGIKFFEKIKEFCISEKRDITEAVNPYQGNLIHPSVRHSEREMFLKNYKKYGFTKAVRRTSLNKKIKKEKIKSRIKQNKFAQNILKLKKLLIKR